MRSTSKIMMLTALLIFSLSLQAQNPITRRVKGDTLRKKSEVVLVKGESRKRGEPQDNKTQAAFQKEFNQLIKKADNAESFNERKELLLKARGMCYDHLKNDCQDLIDDKLSAAYSTEINRLLSRARREDRYEDKMNWLNQAAQLSKATFVDGSDRSKVENAFQSEYRFFVERGNNRSYDLARRLRYFRSALRFCEDYGHIWGAGNCEEALTSETERLFEDALDQQDYDQALEICRSLPGLSNCRQTVYQNQFDDLLDRAAADSDLDDRKRLLEKALDICTRYLQNDCTSTINNRLDNTYSDALEQLFEKARSTRDLRSKLRYYAEAEAICKEANAPGNCQERIDAERNQAFNTNFNVLLEKISRTDNYEQQQELLKDAERLIAKGQLPDERWEDIRRVKHQVHYNQLQNLLFQTSGSFESQMRSLEQAESINEHYLNQVYNRKIQERKVVLITEEINSVLRYENRPFQERFDRLVYAEQLAQQLNRRHRYQLLPKIDEERRRIVSIEYNELVRSARAERHLDEKVERYEEALRFCNEYVGGMASRGGCEDLQQERSDVVSDVYRNMIDEVQRDMRTEFFDKALGTLSLAAEVYQKYGQDLSREMPISTAYQQLYNQYLQSARKYSARGAFPQARKLLQDAQQLEQGQYWVVASDNPVQGQLDEVNRMEMDQKLDQLERLANDRAQNPVILDLLRESCELYAQNRSVYSVGQTSRLNKLYTSVIQKRLNQAFQDIRSQQYASAKSTLLTVKSLSDQYADLGNALSIRGSVEKGFFQWYTVQMDEIEQGLRNYANLSATTDQLDKLKASMEQDSYVRQINGLENRMIRLFQQALGSYQALILSKISRNDFNTSIEERQLETFYQAHTGVFTKGEYDQAKAGIAFARHYEKARWFQDRQQYRQAVDQWTDALQFMNAVPPSYRKAGLAEELKNNRNTAYAAEVKKQLTQIRQEGYQQNRIEGYRSLQQFMDTYRLPLSAYVLDDLELLKEDIFGDVCLQRSQQFYFKLESGDDAINRNNFTAAIRFYEEAKSLATEFPECGIDISLVARKIDQYDAASAFQQKKMALDQLQDKVYSSKRESDFSAYQDAYSELSEFYNQKIMNQGFRLNLVPYQRKVVQIRNNDFWSYVVRTHATDRAQLSFTKDLLRELIEDKRFSETALEKLAAEMATENYKVFGGRNYKETFQYFEIAELKRNKRFKAFKKAYKKQFKRVS
jgi:hypothetical protein